MEYKDLGKWSSYRSFIESGANHMLKESIETFFNCEVTIYPKPTDKIKTDFNIDFHKNIGRGFYPIDSNNALIIARIMESETMISAVGLHLSGNEISKNSKLLSRFEVALTRTFTQEFHTRFKFGILPFGDELIKNTITNYISKGYYDFRKIKHLIDYFNKLRTTSFEGNFFSTGVILTKAVHDFINKENISRSGNTYPLSNWIRINNSNRIDKRLWYLADGKKSFFLSTKNLDFTNLFVLDSNYAATNYLDSHSLALSLKGGDSLFKIENEKLFSITTSGGLEFLFFENQWKFRNYKILKGILCDNVTEDQNIIESIIFYLLSCSKKQISSILWFPADITKVDDLVISNTKNTFLNSQVNITNKDFINHIFRCLSSDGATIIDRNGNIAFIGVIVDLNKTKISGLKGTGESAASVLSTNGVSVKISQDGNIKIFTPKSIKPFLF